MWPKIFHDISDISDLCKIGGRSIKLGSMKLMEHGTTERLFCRSFDNQVGRDDITGSLQVTLKNVGEIWCLQWLPPTFPWDDVYLCDVSTIKLCSSWNCHSGLTPPPVIFLNHNQIKLVIPPDTSRDSPIDRSHHFPWQNPWFSCFVRMLSHP